MADLLTMQKDGAAIDHSLTAMKRHILVAHLGHRSLKVVYCIAGDLVGGSPGMLRW